VCYERGFLAVFGILGTRKGHQPGDFGLGGARSVVVRRQEAIGPAREMRCEIDQKSGDIRAYAKLVVSEKVLSKHDQITVFDARRIKPDAQLGDELEVEVTPAGSAASPRNTPSNP